VGYARTCADTNDYTFEILKSYKGFCIFLPMKDYTLRLCRLEISAKSQVLKIASTE